MKKLFLALTGVVFSVGCAQSPSSDLMAEGTGIIGGAETAVTDNNGFSNSIVSLYNVKEGSLCTASILSEAILVTAAHCLNGPAVNLRVIFNARLVNVKPEEIVARAVVSYQTSPIWAIRQSERHNTGDIAVVRFAGGLPPGFKPAEMLINPAVVQNGVPVVLAGYGMDNGIAKSGSGILRWVETTVESTSYSASEVLIDQRQGKGACHGDSGGPAYVRVGDKWVLFGVTSRGVNDPGDTCGVSAAYTMLPFYRDWVLKTAQQLMQP